MKKFLLSLIIFGLIAVISACATPPNKEMEDAQNALKNAAMGKDCDKENYLAAEALLDKAMEEMNKKEYDKAKELFVQVKKKSEEIVKYYQTHPDECLPKELCGDGADNDGDGNVDCDDDDCANDKNCAKSTNNDTVKELSDEQNPNWEFPSIHFEFNKYEIRYDDKPLVEKMSRWLTNFPEASVRIEGHADERGSIDYNMSLGEKRATEVENQLKMLGINKSRIEVISYGEERPVDDGHTEDAWFKNRRAEFKKIN